MKLMDIVGECAFVQLCTDWLNYRDYSRLEIAVRRMDRKRMFEIISGRSNFPREIEHSGQFYTWCALRNVFPDKVVLNRWTSKSLQMYCENISKFIRTFKVVGNVGTDDIKAVTKSIPYMSSLESFLLMDYYGELDSIISALCGNGSSLTAVTFSKVSCLDDTHLQLISDAYPQLEHVEISHCELVTITGVKHIIQKCTSLEALNLSGCEIFDDTLSAIATEQRQLTTLHIEGCTVLTEAGMAAFIGKVQTITDLNIGFSTRILTDTVVEKIGATFSGLTKLNLAESYEITDEGFLALCKGCVALTDLDVSNVIGLTEKSYFTIVEHLINLQKIRFWGGLENEYGTEAFMTLSHCFSSIISFDYQFEFELSGIPASKESRRAFLSDNPLPVTWTSAGKIADKSVCLAHFLAMNKTSGYLREIEVRDVRCRGVVYKF